MWVWVGVGGRRGSGFVYFQTELVRALTPAVSDPSHVPGAQGDPGQLES